MDTKEVSVPLAPLQQSLFMKNTQVTQYLSLTTNEINFVDI